MGNSAKKFRVKPLTIFNNNLCLSVTPFRAMFKETLGEVRLPKTGGIMIEMIPYEIGTSKDKVVMWLFRNIPFCGRRRYSLIPM